MTLQLIQENQVIYVSGYRMKATNIKFCSVNFSGEDVYSFSGEILDDEELKNTLYNGGSYTWRLSDMNLVPQNIDTNGKRVSKI